MTCFGSRNEAVINKIDMLTEENVLQILKEECEIAGVRKYTCINGFGYSQLERNIASRIVDLNQKPTNETLSLIKILKELEPSGGHQPVTVSMLRYFLEQSIKQTTKQE